MLLKINKAIKSLPSSNATIKGKASQEPKDGWFPAYSASGQDVWLPEYRFATKGIVVSAVGARCGKAFKADGKWNICANTHPLYIDEDIALRDFCWYMLNNEKWWIKGGTAQPFVKVNESLNREFDFPLLTEQKHIVDVLDTLSNILMQKKTEINKLDNLVKARFVELFGDMILNPNGWKKVLLGEACDVRDGTHDSPKYFTEGYPLVTSKNVTGGKIDFSDCNLICEEDYNKINQRSKVDLGDILMPMIGTVGNPVIVDIDEKFAIKNVALIKFKENSTAINSFVKALLESDYFDRAVISKVRGGTQKFISLGDIRKLEICLPPIEVQEQFAAFVKQVDKSKFAISTTRYIYDEILLRLSDLL